MGIMEAYIVIKQCPIYAENCPTPVGVRLSYNTVEGVFSEEKFAKEYISKRKKLKDRDDRGCTFVVEPWHVRKSLEV